MTELALSDEAVCVSCSKLSGSLQGPWITMETGGRLDAVLSIDNTMMTTPLTVSIVIITCDQKVTKAEIN